jgi:hypothetical protein
MKTSKETLQQKQNHLELINTIKKENDELKEKINTIYLKLQEVFLTNTLSNKQPIENEIKVDERINLKDDDVIKNLENNIKKETKEKTEIENEIGSIKKEKEQFIQKEKILKSKIEELKDLISEAKSNKDSLTKTLLSISKKKKNILFYSCSFLNEKNTKIISLFNIEKNIPIKIEIFFSNDGKVEWPKDTILKCKNDDSEIYFLSYRLTEDNIMYAKKTGEEYTSCTVDLWFKNYNRLEEEEYSLRMFLYSDLNGQIGEEIGTFILYVSD